MNCFVREWHLVVTCHQHYTRPPPLVCSSNLKGRCLRKVPEKRLMILKFNFGLSEFSPEDLHDALSPVLHMLYDQIPECLPFIQPVDPNLLQIPVSS